MSSEKRKIDFSHNKQNVPRSFWKKLDRQSKEHLFTAILFLIVLVITFFHGIKVILSGISDTEVLLQLVVGTGAIGLCGLWLFVQISKEIDRIDEAN